MRLHPPVTQQLLFIVWLAFVEPHHRTALKVIDNRLSMYKVEQYDNWELTFLIINFSILLRVNFFSTGCEPDAFEPTLCYIASINNHQEQEQELTFSFLQYSTHSSSLFGADCWDDIWQFPWECGCDDWNIPVEPHGEQPSACQWEGECQTVSKTWQFRQRWTPCLSYHWVRVTSQVQSYLVLRESAVGRTIPTAFPVLAGCQQRVNFPSRRC